MRKRLLFPIAIAILFLLLVFLAEYYCKINIAGYKSLSVLIQLLTIVIIGGIVKKELEIAEKEREFYSKVVGSYNDVKKIIRSFKIRFRDSIPLKDLSDFKDELDEAQLKFELQRDYLIIHSDLHANKKRHLIFASIVNIEARLRQLTKNIEEITKEKKDKYELIDIAGLKSFMIKSGDSFFKYFDEFQKQTYNYRTKKESLKKAAKCFIEKPLIE